MLLAIDTSTRYAGVALWLDGRVVASHCWYSQRNHTAELMPAIQALFERSGACLEEMEGIAVALGPGGFSALRVGISAAKGIALPKSTPLAGVGTLEIEAYPFAGLGLPVCALLDAGREEVATGTFGNASGSWTRLKEERVCTLEELVESIGEPTLLCGEGVPNRSQELRRLLGKNGLVMGPHSPAGRLWALAELGSKRLEKGEADAMEAIQPMYLRRPTIGAPKSPQRIKQ